MEELETKAHNLYKAFFAILNKDSTNLEKEMDKFGEDLENLEKEMSFIWLEFLNIFFKFYKEQNKSKSFIKNVLEKVVYNEEKTLFSLEQFLSSLLENIINLYYSNNIFIFKYKLTSYSKMNEVSFTKILLSLMMTGDDKIDKYPLIFDNLKIIDEFYNELMDNLFLSFKNECISFINNGSGKEKKNSFI